MSLLFYVIMCYQIFLVSAVALRSTMVGAKRTSTGIIVSCLLSPDSIRRTVVIIIGLVMIGIGWYKKTRYDNKVFRYMEGFEEDSF